MDMLALLFECADRGVFSTGGKPWTDREIAAAVGGDIAENLSCLEELLSKGVARRNSSGAIFSARMVRDQQTRIAERDKKRNQRAICPDVVPVIVPPLSVNEDVSEFVYELLKIYPNTKHKTKPTFIEESKACEALARDGKERVFQGTRAFAEAYARWPASDRRFAPGFVKFMESQEYLADPQKWERGKTNESAMAIIDRLARDDDQETGIGAAQGGNR